MSIIRRIIDILVERTVPTIGGLLVSRLETVVTLEEAEHRNELEERARQFESEGKPQLAAALRARAAEINPADPGSHGLAVIRRLQQAGAETSAPLLECQQAPTPSAAPPDEIADNQAQRRSFERRARRPVANDGT